MKLLVLMLYMSGARIISILKWFLARAYLEDGQRAKCTIIESGLPRPDDSHGRGPHMPRLRAPKQERHRMQ